jgi:hypothetical protein
MIEEMPQVHMSEADVVKDIQAVLDKVCQGAEVVVERGYRALAVIAPVKGPGRPIDECIALAKAHEERLGYAPVPDPDFAKDVQAAIDAHRESLEPPKWD